MFKATRRVLAKAPIRPGFRQAQIPQDVLNFSANKNGGTNPKGSLITPVGVAFLLGGLAFASYMFKPTTRLPNAAMDTFKPQIAIIFGTGESKGEFQRAAKELGFAYVDASKGLNELDHFVKAGHTKFFIDGFNDTEAMQKISTDVIQPDLIINFGPASHTTAPRIVNVESGSNTESIAKILEQRNLV